MAIQPVQFQLPSDPNLEAPKSSTNPVADSAAFSEALDKAGASVVDSHVSATKAVEEFTSGLEGNLHETLLSVDKAEITLKFLVNVRNRLLDAYHEIMRMGS